MSFNRKSNLPKKIHSFLTILLFLGLMASLTGQTVSAQSMGNALIPVGKTETPAFIDDNFRPVLTGAASTVNRTLAQPDGKILVAGNFHLMGGANKNYIARFNADGT